MPLTHGQITEGVVAYFDSRTLNKDERIKGPPRPMSDDHPMICLETDGKTSWWAGLTSDRGSAGQRLPVLARWQKGGLPGRWRSQKTFVHGSFYVGENDAFVDAAATVDRYTADRPSVTPEGLAAIKKHLKFS